MMTRLLEKAFVEANKLSPEEQDALAERILADLEAERRWDHLLESSQDVLKQWAEQALAEHRAGQTLPIDRSDR